MPTFTGNIGDTEDDSDMDTLDNSTAVTATCNLNYIINESPGLLDFILKLKHF